MILYRVISPPRQKIGDAGPTVTHGPVQSKDRELLKLAPRGFQDSRVQMVIPSLPALFTSAAIDVKLATEHIGDHTPVFMIVNADEVHNSSVFSLGPCSSLG